MFRKEMEALKAELKGQIRGKFMIRQDRSYRGLEQQGIYRYKVYYEIPTPDNRAVIKELAEKHGFSAFNQQVIGGSYGFTIALEQGGNK